MALAAMSVVLVIAVQYTTRDTMVILVMGLFAMV
jgi:hypothetical protein